MSFEVRRLAWAGVFLLTAALGAAQAQEPGSVPETPAPAPVSAKPQAPTQASNEARPPSVSGNPVLERVLAQWPGGRIDTVKKPGQWAYEEGTLLDGVAAEWRVTGDGRLFNYIKAAVDHSVDKDGVIHMEGGAAFPSGAHSLDDIEMGRSAIVLYRVLQQERYYKAAKFLHDQVLVQPKNTAGGYWHKGIYPDQMWLDGAYMAEPFMAMYARTFDQPGDMVGIANQLLLMDAKMRDRQTGLLHHGWDASKKMGWADKHTGLSPEIWSRAMGWYTMALVEVLERMPASDPQRAALEAATRRVLTAVAHYQDPVTGLWWDVMDKASAKGNFLEASASCMFVYSLAKAIRLDLLPMTFETNVSRGWGGIQSHFVKSDGTFTGTVKVSGLGGEPYRSGTYEYYVGEAVGDNDAKGVGVYLLAHSEIEQRDHAGELLRRAKGKIVLVDGWFNSQKRKTADGRQELFHYKWNDDANSGYSIWGRMFQQYGMRTEVLDHAPRAEDLKDVDVYVIVSPDIPALNPNPNYMDKASAEAIEAWVKAGGVLVLMENDSEHADQTHLDLLTDRFGIHYNPVTRNREVGTDYSTTLVKVPSGTGGIFHHDFIGLEKEVCTITVSAPAKSILVDGGDALMAVAYPGRGVVYANVDPWIYNEYTDGRKTPLGEQNFAAGQELTRWIVHEAVTH
ncbi:MAG TPA: glycoside hydrolase family 88 protein [Acidobacteriaceae bacterium]